MPYWVFGLFVCQQMSKFYGIANHPIARRMYNPINCPDINMKHDARGADRFELYTETEGVLSHGGAETIVVHNLSATGLLVETEAMLQAGQRIYIALPDAGPTAAIVVWTGEALYGCRFEQPISQEALVAARKQDVLTMPDAVDVTDVLLVDPYGADASKPNISFATAAPITATVPAASTAQASADMPLSVRLRTLREAQGLSLAALSRRAGISKPSIWAWETGKTVPRARSIDALARALGVDVTEILGRDAGSVQGSNAAFAVPSDSPAARRLIG